jgi:hypothetical protein
MARSDARITIRLPRGVVERLDALAAERGCGRARIVELLIEDASPSAPLPARGRAIVLLAQSAESGSVPARVALARLLARDTRSPVQQRRDELATRRSARGG